MDDDDLHRTSPTHYQELQAGSLLNEFEIVATLGSGGFGITYLALDTFLQEKVAVKEYFPSELAVRTSDTTVKARTAKDQQTFTDGLKAFLQEARLLARFRHKNIVHVRRFFEFHGTGYIVLDYERGETLSKRLERGPLDEKQLRDVISGILDGLSLVHERAILHRDLKPTNIILRSADGSPALIDFGAARDFGSRSTKTTTTLGTPGYSPPEQQGAGGQQGPWSDLYALGATIYKAVTGSAPVSSIGRLRTDTLVPATVAAQGKYSPRLLEVTDWMLRIPEAERPISVDAVRAALTDETDLPGPGAFPVAAQATVDAIADKFEQDTSTYDPPPEPPPEIVPAVDVSRTGSPSSNAVAIRSFRFWSVLALSLATVGAASFYFLLNEPGPQDRKPQERPDFRSILTQTPDEIAALKRFLEQCGANCPADIADQARERIARLDRNAARLTELESALARTPDDATALQQFLDICGVDCPTDIKMRAEQRIDAVKKEILRRAELATTLADTADDVPSLQRFLDNCGNDCPADIATQTKQRIDQLNRESARRIELTGTLARMDDDVSALQQFLGSCGSDCPTDVAQQARQRIDRLNNEAARRAGLSATLARLSDDRSGLEQFLQTCGPDCPKDIATRARERIDQIDRDTARQSELGAALARTPDDTSALQQFLDQCGADCPASIQKQASDRRDAINRKKMDYARLAERLSLTGDNLDGLLQFLNQCGPDCPADLSENAKAKIKALTVTPPTRPPVSVGPNVAPPKPERKLGTSRRTERAQTPSPPRRQDNPAPRRSKCFNFNGATFCE